MPLLCPITTAGAQVFQHSNYGASFSHEGIASHEFDIFPEPLHRQHHLFKQVARECDVVEAWVAWGVIGNTVFPVPYLKRGAGRQPLRP